MAAFQETPRMPWKGARILQNILRGGGSALLNLIILILPLTLAIQGLYMLQRWLFEDKGALYFHSYTDKAASTVSLLLLLSLILFYIQVLRYGIRNIQKTVKRYTIPILVAIPLLLMVLDSYLLIGPDKIVQSPFWNIGRETTHTWDDVTNISVGHSVGTDDELFSGTYLLHFKDGSSLEIWKAGGMSATDLKRVDRLATARGIPFTVNAPLSTNAIHILEERGWTPAERAFLEQLFQR
ncbi:hypothetical protein [Salinithrix halophila]|uniref:PH domain-containing protein n=1 Tax=Salinithrix halophila TaxID=1485204 RepID=A0ABV8JG93_9BACL